MSSVLGLTLVLLLKAGKHAAIATCLRRETYGCHVARSWLEVPLYGCSQYWAGKYVCRSTSHTQAMTATMATTICSM